MSIILVDSYGESNYQGGFYLYNGEYTRVSHSLVGQAGTLASCKFYLKTFGSPIGNVVAKLYSHSGTYGISSVPDTLLATSDNIDATTISSIINLITFNFSTPYTLVDGTYYCISVEYSGGDSSNIVFVGRHNSGTPIHSGNVAFYKVAWLPDDIDLIFYVYADYTPPVPDPEAPPYSSVLPDIKSIATPISLKTTKIINGAWTAKMQILPDDYIKPESYIDITDNGIREEYVVKKLEKIKSGGKYYYDVDLILNAMEELTAHKVEQFYFQKSVEDCAAFLLTNTQWTLGICDIDEIIILESVNKISSLEGLNQLVEKCNGELYWHSKTHIVDIKREIGNITGLQLRHDKNCTEIKRIEDSGGLVTRIYPTGPDNYTINTITLDNCEDETVWIPSSGGSVALSSNKRQGSSSIEINSSTLNETFIRNLGAGSVKDLTGCTLLKFWIYSAVANALGFTFGIGESAYTEQTVNTGALSENCWAGIELDLSTVANSAKNAIRYLGFKNLTGGVVTASFDNIRAFNGEIYVDSPNASLYKVKKEYVYNHSAKPEKTQFEVIIYPSDDATVSQEYPNQNSTGLHVKNLTGYDWIPYLKFPLTVIPNSAVIVSVKLGLYCASIYGFAATAGTDVESYLVNADWNENILTYNNKPAVDAVNIHTFDMKSEGLKEADFTTVIENWFDGSVSNYGIKLSGTTPAENNGSIIYSKESSINQPYLKIVYTLMTDPSTVIEAAARAYMALWDIPYLSFSGKAHDLSMVTEGTWKDETIGIGDTVKMYDSEIKDSEGKPLNVNIRVKSIVRNILSPTDIDIELANKVYTFADLQARIYKQLKYAMPYEDNPRIINASAIQEGYLGGSVNV